MRPLDEVVRDCFRLSDFDSPYDAAIASARLAVRAYVATAGAVHSLHITEPTGDEEEQRTRDYNLGARYRDAAFETIIHFQHFAELVVKSVLRADHELLVIVGERHHKMLRALLHGEELPADDERRLQTIEASVALERLAVLLEEGALDQSWRFVLDHRGTIERLNALRNRLWHRGEVVLRYRAVDELIGGYALPFLLKVAQHPSHHGREQLWMHKPLACGLDPLPLIATEVTQVDWSARKVAFLKELARAAFENPLEDHAFFRHDDARRRRRAEAVADEFPEHEVDRISRCPVCGIEALVVYRASDDTGPDFTWLAKCEGCSLEVRSEYGNASEHGLPCIEDYFGAA